MSIKRVVLFLTKTGFLGVALLLVAGLSALGTMRIVLSSEEVVVPSVVAEIGAGGRSDGGSRTG